MEAGAPAASAVAAVPGIDLIRKFLNFAGPAVYVIMILLMIMIWSKAGGGLISEVGNIFSGVGDYTGGTFSAFLAVFGTMVAYFAAVVINFGDFSGCTLF